MKTEILNFQDKKVEEILLENDVVGFPTETVYGLAVVYDSSEAFTKLCNLKDRPVDKPFTIMVDKKEQISSFVNLNEKMHRIIDKFMPGEITILFPIKEGLYPWLSLNSPSVGIRISASEEVRDLIKRVNKPLLVTSANMSSHPPLNTDKEVYDVFNGKIRGIVKGSSSSTIPSTIVLIKGDELVLIRQGSIPFDIILEEWEK